MSKWEIQNPQYEEWVRESFASNPFLNTIGAEIRKLIPGYAEIRLPYRKDLAQQQGYLHGGVITAVLDSACGYAALTLMPESSVVLAVEFKINLLSPARGGDLVACGRVIKPGGTIWVCQGEASVRSRGADSLVAAMQATMIAVLNREGLAE